MATLNEEKQQRKELGSNLDLLINIQPESLVREAELGQQLNFKEGLPLFNRIHNLFKELSECNFDNIPITTLRTFTTLTNTMLSHLDQIKDFAVDKHTNPSGQRAAFINGAQVEWEKAFPQIKQYISYAHPRIGDIGRQEQQAQDRLVKLSKIETEYQVRKNKNLKEMEGALEAVRAAAAKVGVAHHAIHFKEEADLHRRQAYVWLAAAALFAGGIIWYAIFYLPTQLVEVAGSIPTAQLEGVAERVLTARLVQFVLSRVIVVSILSFGLVFCGRQYTASRHNFVVNRHRQNALRSFETFASAASDPATKDSVLIQATRAIFDPQASGYSKGDQGAQPSSHYTEIVRGISGSQAS